MMLPNNLVLEVGRNGGAQGKVELAVADMEEETRRMKSDYTLIFFVLAC